MFCPVCLSRYFSGRVQGFAVFGYVWCCRMGMERLMIDTVARHNMLSPGDRVAVACSGGADSVALLYCLYSNREALGIGLAACHVNHRLRGDESERDEAFVRELCTRMDIPYHVFRVDVKARMKEEKESLELSARHVRYEVFDSLDGKVATAHTLSDSMETVLLHMARGTGLAGLRGIPPVRDNIIRPLIDCTRAQIEAYCRENGLSYVTDSSNMEEYFTRNRIRRQIIPRIYDINSGFDAAFRRMTELLREDEDYLARSAGEAMEGWMNGGCSAQALRDLPASVRRRIVGRLLQHNKFAPDYRTYKKIDEILDRGGALELKKGLFFQVKKGKVSVWERPELVQPFHFPLQCGDFSLFPGKKIRVICNDCEQTAKFSNNSPKTLKSGVDCDKIVGTVFVRQRLPGDKFTPAGRGLTKPLKKCFNEAGIDPYERDRLAVVADSRGVIWVEGFGPAERVAVTDETRRAVQIAIFACADNMPVTGSEQDL